MKNGKIQSFTDLNVWKEGHKLVLMIYKITASFPQKETYSIIDQMRRAAASITANVAEGFGRRKTSVLLHISRLSDRIKKFSFNSKGCTIFR